MAEETQKSFGKMTIIAILLGAIVSLVYYYYTSNWLPAIGLFLLVVGVYELLSSFFRSTEDDRWGTNESGAAALFGFLMVAVGGAIVVYQYADSIIIPIVFALAVIILYVVYSLFRKKKA